MNGNELILLRRIEDLENYIKRVPEVGGVWKNWTPTWTASTTNPSIGNGTLSGRYCLIGKLITAKIFLQLGSTSTAGSGAYSFTFPIAPLNYRLVSGVYRLRNVGGNLYEGAVEPFSATFALIRDGGTYVTNATPFSFADQDIIGIGLSYEIA
jgi:hypothetical protein